MLSNFFQLYLYFIFCSEITGRYKFFSIWPKWKLLFSRFDLTKRDLCALSALIISMIKNIHFRRYICTIYTHVNAYANVRTAFSHRASHRTNKAATKDRDMCINNVAMSACDVASGKFGDCLSRTSACHLHTHVCAREMSLTHSMRYLTHVIRNRQQHFTNVDSAYTKKNVNPAITSK